MRVYLRTFGCRANHYDTETARAMIERAGHAIVTDAAEADIAVFNSCAVTAEAEADLRQAGGRAAPTRAGFRGGVMGCAPGPPRSPHGFLPRRLATGGAARCRAGFAGP